MLESKFSKESESSDILYNHPRKIKKRLWGKISENAIGMSHRMEYRRSKEEVKYVIEVHK